jgi:predicted nucleic acid-binding protein
MANSIVLLDTSILIDYYRKTDKKKFISIIHKFYTNKRMLQGSPF